MTRQPLLPTLGSLLLVLAVTTIGGCSLTSNNTDPNIVDAAIADPTILIQGPNAEQHLTDAGLTPGPTHNTYTAESVNASLLAAVEAGDGDRLYTLKQSLIPLIVTTTLTTGNSDPQTLPNLAWLGHIDGRIDLALTFGQHEPDPNTKLDPTPLIEPGLVPLVATSTEIDPNQINLELVTEIVDSLHNTHQADPTLPHHQRIVIEENLETAAQSTALLTTLHAAGYADIPEGQTADDFFSTLYEVPILDESGNPLIINGTPITADDWLKKFAAYTYTNDDVEREHTTKEPD